jgi:nicotinate-nucleotide--dimethylbenzimidazole phosphoribosyltransferase
VTGRGTGLDEVGWRHKAEVIQKALDLHRPNPTDALDLLSKVGGFEIGGLAGVIIAGAASRIPVILDGFIAGAAALLASLLAPPVRHFLIAGHCSAEPGHVAILQHLGLRPYLDLEMRLGEGTGAALAIGLCRAALAAYNEMATFKSAGVSTSTGMSDVGSQISGFEQSDIRDLTSEIHD